MTTLDRTGADGRRDERDRRVDLGGPVHYVDFGGNSDGPTFVLVHGLGGSHLTILLAARSPESVTGLVLLDPALPPPLSRLRNTATGAMFLVYALPGVGERLMRGRRARLGPRALVHATLLLCGIDPATVPPDLIARSIALIERRSDVAGMDRAFLSATRSLLWVLTWARSYRRAMSAVRAPVLLVHGAKDRLVPVAAARDAARRLPHWHYVELAGVGHVPSCRPPTSWPASSSTGSPPPADAPTPTGPAP